MDVELVDLESAYQDANVVVTKSITENGKEDEIVINHERCSDNGMTPSELQTVIKPNLKGDRLNVTLLVLFYMLQGVPIGISFAIRTYMQNMKVSYIQQVILIIYI